MSETWKSPRAIEQEINQYRRDRFEYYMAQAALGVFETVQEAIDSLRSEIENTAELESKVA